MEYSNSNGIGRENLFNLEKAPVRPEENPCSYFSIIVIIVLR